MIAEDYVSLDVAKLLKDKGFKFPCRAYYTTNGRFIKTEMLHNWDNPAPILQMALKWLREEKHYYIQIMLDSWALGGHCGFYVVIQRMDSDFEMMLADAVEKVFYNTPEEAANAALLYVLRELI